MDEAYRTMLLYKRIYLEQLFERQTDICRESFVFQKGVEMDEAYRTMLLYKRIYLEQLFERQTDRILYGYNLKYAPARHLVKPLLIPPKTKIPKVDIKTR